MADFAAILEKTLGKMGETTPQTRAVVYDKARETVRRQIDAMAKQPPQAAIDRQFERLEDAIAATEARYAAEAAAAAEIAAPIVEPAPDIAPPVAVEPEMAAPPEPEPVVDTPEPAADPDPLVGNEPKAQSDRDPLLDFLDEQSAAMDDAPASPRSRFEADADEAADMLFGNDAGKPDMSADDPFLPDAHVDRGSDAADDTADDEDRPGAGRRYGRLAIAAVLIMLFGFGGYLVFAQRGPIAEFANQFGITMPGGAGGTQDGDLPVRTVETVTVTQEDGAAGSDQNQTEIVNAGGETSDVEKFTQRLTEDGREIDEGPAAAAGATGEGTSVAGQTNATGSSPVQGQDATADTQTETPAAGQPGGVAIGQDTILYEERTGSQAGTANQGATVWSVVQEEPADGLPLEPAVRAESAIPDLGLNMEMTIRRNGDPTFPASHIIELFFTVPDTFAGGGIADVQRITFKNTEQDPGNALIAVPAPIDTNIFLIALTDAPQAVETNVALMRDQGWIDIPMQYVNGRRALITLEKGAVGQQVFDEVFDAWQAAQNEAAEQPAETTEGQ